MLEIYANGKKLHLPDDISVDMTFENPLLAQDRVPTTYSMSFNLPPTRENLQIVGNTNRVAANGMWSEMVCKILFNSITISTGKLLLQESEKNLKFSFVGSFIPEAVKTRMDWLSIGRYDFGEGLPYIDDFDSGGWPQAYRDTILSKSRDIGAEFAACPVRVTSQEWVGDELTGGFVNTSWLYLNMWNVNKDCYWFWDIYNPDMHGAIFPQPYIHHLIDLVFGTAINNNLFKDDAELKKLAMVTSYHKLFNFSQYFPGSRGGVQIDDWALTAQRYFYISSFFTNYHFNDFLKNILKMFCFSLMPRVDGRWDIVHNKTILEGTEIIDWSGKLAGVPTTGMQKGQRYGYGYGSEKGNPEDGGYATVNSIEAMLASSVATKFLISTTKEIYEKKLKDEEVPGVYVYERLETGLGSLEKIDEDNGTYAMQSEVTPVRMRVDDYWYENAPVTRYPWYVPEFSGDRSDKSAVPQVGFMRGFYDIPAKKTDQVITPYIGSGHYPFMTPYNCDPAGNVVGNYSLAWEGANGLLSKFHSEFKEYIERDKLTLKGDFRLTHLDLKNLDYKKKIYIRGKLFFLKKIETTFRKKGISFCRCELIEA